MSVADNQLLGHIDAWNVDVWDTSPDHHKAKLRDQNSNATARHNGTEVHDDDVFSDDPYTDVPTSDDDAPPEDGDEPPEPRLKPLLLNRTALNELPNPEPLIDNVLDQGTVSLLYGKWGTCKSFIALDWGLSVATGRTWQGRTTEKRRVLYIAAEGAFGMKSRVDAWERGWHTTIADGDFEILPHPVNLTNPLAVGELMALIDWNGYGFVVIDTLARCMVGADENSAKDCGVVVDNLTRLRESTPGGRGTVNGVHHTGKDGKTFRGSSVFEAGADTVYAVTRDGPDIHVDREKRKDGPPTDSHTLRLDLIDGTGSGVLGVSHTDVRQLGRKDELRLIFEGCFETTGATGAQFKEAAMEAGISKPTYYRALSDLLESCYLVNTGSDKRPFYMVAK